jgi:hypothetical protein
MGIIMGAIGGAGSALQDIGSTMMKSDLALENETKLAGVRSDLETKRQQTLEEFKNTLATNTANQQRDAQASRIGAAQQGIVGRSIDQKYAQSDAAVAAAAGGASPEVSAAEGNEGVQAALTPEQMGVINQAKAGDRQKLMDDPSTFTQAAIRTGDISPKDAMSNASKTDINQLKMDSLLARAEDKNATAKEIAEARAEAQKYGYELRLQAAQERNANGKIDTATGRMLITSEDVNIKADTTQMGMLTRKLDVDIPKMKGGKPNPDYQTTLDQIEELRTSINESKANKAEYLKSMKVMPPKAASGSGGGSPVGGSPYPEGTELTGPGGAPYVVRGGVPVLK